MCPTLFVVIHPNHDFSTSYDSTDVILRLLHHTDPWNAIDLLWPLLQVDRASRSWMLILNRSQNELHFMSSPLKFRKLRKLGGNYSYRSCSWCSSCQHTNLAGTVKTELLNLFVQNQQTIVLLWIQLVSDGSQIIFVGDQVFPILIDQRHVCAHSLYQNLLAPH